MSAALKIITVMNLIELAVLIGIATIGAFQIEAPNLEPFAPLGFGSFASGMALVYISYVGFDLITVAAEEIIAPGKTIPRAILITLVVGVLIYVVVVFVMMGTVHYTELATSDVPFIFVAEAVAGGWGRWAAITATIMASLSAFSVTLGASSRVLFALSRDASLPPGAFQAAQALSHPAHRARRLCSVRVRLCGGGDREVRRLHGGLWLLDGAWLRELLGHRAPQTNAQSQATLPCRLLPLDSPDRYFHLLGWSQLDSDHLLGIGLTLAAAVYLIRPLNRPDFSKSFVSSKRSSDTGSKRERMRVLIIGDGQKEQYANRLLAKDEYRLRFRSHEHRSHSSEVDEGALQRARSTLQRPIFQGDGTKKEVLQQVGLNNIDVAIAAADNDGSNVIAALRPSNSA